MNRSRLPLSPLAWSDFQLVLAIARQGSVARTTGVLSMSHATLLRRLEQIESRLHARLFERVRGRYSLTAAGHEIVEAARTMEPVAEAAQSRARGQDTRPSGDVRLSTSSIVATHLLPPVLAQFGSAFPEVRIELSTSREHTNLRRREADVALRIADSVPDWLVGRELAQLRFKVYTRLVGKVRPALRSPDELCRQRGWIVFERDAYDQKFDRWFASHVDDAKAVLRVDNFTHAAALARAGLGMALLPSFIERSLPDLVPLTAPLPELQTPLWLVTHPDLAGTARVQVLLRAFGPAMANALQRASAD
jgi:DNA-binding transcriptional LysR family regulator